MSAGGNFRQMLRGPCSLVLYVSGIAVASGFCYSELGHSHTFPGSDTRLVANLSTPANQKHLPIGWIDQYFFISYDCVP